MKFLRIFHKKEGSRSGFVISELRIRIRIQIQGTRLLRIHWIHNTDTGKTGTAKKCRIKTTLYFRHHPSSNQLLGDLAELICYGGQYCMGWITKEIYSRKKRRQTVKVGPDMHDRSRLCVVVSYLSWDNYCEHYLRAALRGFVQTFWDRLARADFSRSLRRKENIQFAWFWTSCVCWIAMGGTLTLKLPSFFHYCYRQRGCTQ